MFLSLLLIFKYSIISIENNKVLPSPKLKERNITVALIISPEILENVSIEDYHQLVHFHENGGHQFELAKN